MTSNSLTIPLCWSPIPTQEHGVLAMMQAPLRPGNRPVGAAKLAVEDTSTDGPVFAATPGVTARGPKTDAGFP